VPEQQIDMQMHVPTNDFKFNHRDFNRECKDIIS